VNLARPLVVARKELLQLRRDRLTMGMMVALPVMQLLLFGYAINNDVRHIPTVVYDQDRSAASRELTAGLRATGFYDVVGEARDFAEVRWDGEITLEAAKYALDQLRVDELGLDQMDRRLLSNIIDHYDGGPVGLDTLSASLGEPRDTIEEVIEPFLIQQGFLKRTPRGREVTPRAYEHVKKVLLKKSGGQQPLF